MSDFLKRLRARRVFEQADAGAGGAGSDAAADAAAGDAGTAGTGQGAAARWWEDGKRFDDGTRAMLAAKGLTVDDPLEAMGKLSGMYTAAEKRLGKSPDRLMERPADGQDLTEWMRGNAEMFGIPADAEGYTLERPKDWPKDAKWDDQAESALRKVAHEQGLSGRQAQAMVDTYAGLVMQTLTGSEQQAEQASAALMADLKKDWGDQTDAKKAQAQRAWEVAAEAAGLDATAALNAAFTLSETMGGDANVLRLFAALGDMMGDDTLTRGPGTAGQIGTTPAEARAELHGMLRQGSEYFAAMTARQEGKPVPNWEALQQRRAYLEKIATQK